MSVFNVSPPRRDLTALATNSHGLRLSNERRVKFGLVRPIDRYASYLAVWSCGHRQTLLLLISADLGTYEDFVQP